MGSGEIPNELEIAGSLREPVFRGSLGIENLGGRALFGRGARHGLPTSDKLRMPMIYVRSQTMSDKIHRRKGNSPDHQLRSLNIC